MSVDIIINDPRWNDINLDVDLVVKTIRDHLTIKKEAGFSLLLTNDEEIKIFNSTYRDKDKATNVLSFPCENIEGYVGDLIISYETVEKECCDQKKNHVDHSIHMITHGFLHLLGYDHVKDKDAEVMEAHEIVILSRLNIKNPYDISP
ncbi:MAG: rRNA maturation RNase YbeY [Alphaproteobacteria bacterium]|nr:rRNA maturation RNase YbeY [Alphaproteobacteria bacterium]